jgi:hypothetical protein
LNGLETFRGLLDYKTTPPSREDFAPKILYLSEFYYSRFHANIELTKTNTDSNKFQLCRDGNGQRRAKLHCAPQLQHQLQGCTYTEGLN